MKQGQRAIWHDYRSVGFYMLTLVTAGRRPLFGQVVAPGVMALTPTGHKVLEAWRAISSFRPQIESSTLCVMPDHLHSIIFVREQLTQPLGAMMRGFKSGVTASLRQATGDSALEVWEEGYHDGIALEPASIKAWHCYILDNPRRLWLKRMHPDLFVRVNTLEHPRLPVLPDGQKWAGYGNLFLLDKPELVLVRVSRSATSDEIEQVARTMTEKVRKGAVAVSPFISPGEQTVVRAIAAENTANNGSSGNKTTAAGHYCPASEAARVAATGGGIILIKPGGFPPLYKPGGIYFDLCVQGRLLVLSGCAYTGHKTELTREHCLRMNGWCEHICSHQSPAL